MNHPFHESGAPSIVLGLAGRITLGLECQEVEWQVEDLLKEHEKKIIFDFSELKYLVALGWASWSCALAK